MWSSLVQAFYFQWNISTCALEILSYASVRVCACQTLICKVPGDLEADETIFSKLEHPLILSLSHFLFLSFFLPFFSVFSNVSNKLSPSFLHTCYHQTWLNRISGYLPNQMFLFSSFSPSFFLLLFFTVLLSCSSLQFYRWFTAKQCQNDGNIALLIRVI